MRRGDVAIVIGGKGLRVLMSKKVRKNIPVLHYLRNNEVILPNSLRSARDRSFCEIISRKLASYREHGCFVISMYLTYTLYMKLFTLISNRYILKILVLSHPSPVPVPILDLHNSRY